MPLATKEQAAAWGFETDGFDAWVYLTDGMLATGRDGDIKAGIRPLPLQEAMAREIRDLGMFESEFARVNGGDLAMRGDTALVYMAFHKGPDYAEANERRVKR